MKIEIDLLTCQDFGECVFSAPHIFQMDENGKQSLRKNGTDPQVIFDASDEYSDEVEEAVIVCPMQALTIIQ